MPKLTLVEIPDHLMMKATGLRDLEAEFTEVFGREADDGDRALGLERSIDTMRSLNDTLAKLDACPPSDELTQAAIKEAHVSAEQDRNEGASYQRFETRLAECMARLDRMVL